MPTSRRQLQTSYNRQMAGSVFWIKLNQQHGSQGNEKGPEMKRHEHNINEQFCWFSWILYIGPMLLLTCIYVWTVIIFTGKVILLKISICYLLQLEKGSKTRRRATLLLPTWICSCQSVGTVNFALPFTTNVTISISILQTFRSWVATSHLRPPMAFLSHNSSDTPGLAPLMNVLFWGRCDFPISFSGRDMSRNVWNRL